VVEFFIFQQGYHMAGGLFDITVRYEEAILLMMDNIVMESVSAYATGQDIAEATRYLEVKRSSLLTHIFLTAYNMGRAGDPLIKVPAGCEHNHGMAN